MRPICLASSSHGNCYVFEFNVNGVPTRLMVECGIPKSTMFQRLNKEGIDITSISACLITHAHGDHSCAAIDINRLGIPIFATQETLNAIHVDGTAAMSILQPIKICEGIYAMPFEVEHDCPGAVGFVIKTKNECVIFVNDHKRWTCNLRNFRPDYVFIECNYFHKVVYAQVGELRKLIKTEISYNDLMDAKQKLAQHKRNLDAHCSLNGTIYGLKKLNLTKCKAIFLMHLSDRYANEYKMKNEVELSTQILTKVCGKDGGIK